MKSLSGFEESFVQWIHWWLLPITFWPLIPPLRVTEDKMENKICNTEGLCKIIVCKLELIFAFLGNNQPEHNYHSDDRP